MTWSHGSRAARPTDLCNFLSDSTCNCATTFCIRNEKYEPKPTDKIYLPVLSHSSSLDMHLNHFYFSISILFNLFENENKKLQFTAVFQLWKFCFVFLAVTEDTEKKKKIYRLTFFSELALVIPRQLLHFFSMSTQTIEFSWHKCLWRENECQGLKSRHLWQTNSSSNPEMKCAHSLSKQKETIMIYDCVPLSNTAW